MGVGAVLDTQRRLEVYADHSVFDVPLARSTIEAQRTRVADAASALYRRRSELCVEHSMGLTKLYNLMDDGAFADLASLHNSLDVAVAAAYGWPASAAQDAPELVRRLTALNRQIVEGSRPYQPFPL